MSPSTNQHPVFFTGWMPFLSPAKLSARCNSDGDQGKLSSGQTSFLYDEKFPLSINQNFKLKKFSAINCQCFISKVGYQHLTRSSADADKITRRIKRSVKVTKHSTMLGIFLLCNSNFVLRRAGFPIFDFKDVVTLKSRSEVTQGH